MLADVARPCAFVFLRTADRVVVAELSDDDEGTFYRPPGGGIEFGERAVDAAVREMREEFGITALDPADLTLLGVIENVFTWHGELRHEICFTFEALVDADLLEELDGTRVRDSGGSEVARVVALSELAALSPLYPDGVRALVSAWA